MVFKLSKLLKWLVATLIIVFLVKYLLNNYNQIEWTTLNFNYPLLFISIIILIISYLMWPPIWQYLLKQMNFKIKTTKIFQIFFSSLIGRYVPGKITLFLARVYMCKKAGIEEKTAFTSIIIDTALFTLSGIILFLITIPFFTKLPSWLLFSSISIAIITIFLSHPKIITKIINFGLKIIKKEPIKIKIKYSQILFILIFHTVRWFIQGIAIYLFAKSIIEIPSELFIVIPGIFSISIVLGMVILIAPGGLGIREGLIVLLLTPFISAGPAIMLSLTSRILLTVSETGLALLFEILNKKNKIKNLIYKLKLKKHGF
jgi:glycosyltransferase 2 family protein